MSLGRVSTAAAVALAMVSSPVLAQAANPAAKLSVAAAKKGRAGAATENESNFRGGFIIPLIAVAAVVLGILVLVDNDDDTPSSP